MIKNGIKLTRVPLYYLMSNGAAEGTVQIIKCVHIKEMFDPNSEGCQL